MAKPTQKHHLPHPDSRRTRYRVVNHREAGLFDTMTGATAWALCNVPGWDWSIEPVRSGVWSPL
jgi:hypothetical protein